MPTTQFKVSDMDCLDCVKKVERAVRGLDGVTEVSANLMSQVVRITHNGNDREAFKQAIHTVGYTVADDARTVFSIPDMECAGCAEKVETAIRELAGITEVITSVMSQKVTVFYAPEAVSQEGISTVIRDAGYTPGEGKSDAQPTPSFWKNRKNCFFYAPFG